MSIVNRLQTLRELMSSEGLDVMFVSSPENRRYLSGFTGTYGYLMISESDSLLMTDFRYFDQAIVQASGFEVERVFGGVDWFASKLVKLNAKKVGFESKHMTIASHNSFAEALKNINITYRPDFVGCFDLVDRMRMQKQEVEIESLKRAIDITDQAFVRVLSVIRPGKTESEIAWEIEKSVRELGAESLAFDTIVGSGINGAIPHHATGDTLIASGEPIVIDMGARYQGYCADLTRTVFLGDPDDQFVKVYNTVRDAQASAIEGVKPGMTGADLDTISRQVIDKAGYGENFGHSLGHGVGLAVHELPNISPKSDDVLKDGMVFTIEPGIYLPGWGGVRIEDVVLLEDGRAKIVSTAPKTDTSFG